MPRRFPIRAKLTFGALVPLFVAIGICSLAGLYIIDAKIASQAQEKVRTDLNSAREVYGNELRQMADLVEYAASTPIAGGRVSAAQVVNNLTQRAQLSQLAGV